MCGINLILNCPGDISTDSAVQKMNDTLIHRGPDAQGISIRGPVALGHTRLTIVDLEAGQQPLESADGRFSISYNGEIYNYKILRQQLEQQGFTFRTHTDTEVLLNLYIRHGEQCLDKLRGMFAFAIHDRQDDTVFIARDRLGIKPLYYHTNGDTLVASSEIKAIFASGLVTPQFNFQSLYNYFFYQFAITPYTIFQDVLELPPGHSMLLTPGERPQPQQYWDIEFPMDGEYESMEEEYWLDRFEQGLHDAVASHTTGDVPIGSYLSGGIDSSAITWMLTQTYDKPLETFSIQFTDPNEDESAIYSAIAEHLQLSNQELVMGNDIEGGYLKHLERCLYHLEQPQRMAVDIPHYLLSGLVQQNKHKVVYTGDGADEILGGYDCFRQDYMRVWGNQIEDPRKKREHYLKEYTQWYAEDFIQMILDLHAPEKQDKVISDWGTYPAWFDIWHVTGDLLPNLFSESFIDAQKENRQMENLREQMKPKLEGRHVLNQSLYIETKTRLPGWILWKSDRLSMAHNVEARVPFMDHKLVELAAHIPPGLKLSEMDEKYILRKVAMPHLPEHPSMFKKKAFYTPIKEWLFDDDQAAELDKYLDRAALERSGMFNPDTVDDLLNALIVFPTPQNLTEGYRRMQLEWVLMLVLSIQILHHQFIELQADCFKH